MLLKRVTLDIDPVFITSESVLDRLSVNAVAFMSAVLLA